MTSNIIFLRQFCRTFQSRADSTRVFFPDDKVGSHATGSATGEQLLEPPVFWASAHNRRSGIGTPCHL